MTDSTLADWLPIADAAARIGCSTRTVERLARAKQLEQRLRPQAGSPAVAVYNPDDVDRIAAERHPAPPPFVLDAGRAAGNGNGQGRAGTSTKIVRASNESLFAADSPFQQFFALLIQMAQSPPSSPVSEMAETKYVTVKDAAAILGLPQADVRRLIHDGDLNHRLTGRGGIRIRRKDLEAL